MAGSGRVLISSFSSSGKTLLTVKGPFDTFGELLVARNLRAHRRAYAHIDTQVYKVSESDLARLCHSYPELALAFIKLAVEMWRQKREGLEDMIFLSAQQRVLKRTSERPENVRNSGSNGIRIEFTSDSIAHPAFAFLRSSFPILRFSCASLRFL